MSIKLLIPFWINIHDTYRKIKDLVHSPSPHCLSTRWKKTLSNTSVTMSAVNTFTYFQLTQHVQLLFFFFKLSLYCLSKCFNPLTQNTCWEDDVWVLIKLPQFKVQLKVLTFGMSVYLVDLPPRCGNAAFEKAFNLKRKKQQNINMANILIPSFHLNILFLTQLKYFFFNKLSSVCCLVQSLLLLLRSHRKTLQRCPSYSNKPDREPASHPPHASTYPWKTVPMTSSWKRCRHSHIYKSYSVFFFNSVAVNTEVMPGETCWHSADKACSKKTGHWAVICFGTFLAFPVCLRG